MSELRWFDLLSLFCNYKWWRYISTVFSSDSTEPFCEEIKQYVFDVLSFGLLINSCCPHFAIFIKFEDRFVKIWPLDGCSSDLDGGETEGALVCMCRMYRSVHRDVPSVFVCIGVGARACDRHIPNVPTQTYRHIRDKMAVVAVSLVTILVVNT